MAGSCDALMLADSEHNFTMERASNRLARRMWIERGLAAPLVDDSREEGLIWRLPSGGEGAPIRYPGAALALAQKEAALARVVVRDPCPNCGTRADIGCKHQRLAA
jgi:hypothetical protein